MLFSQSVTSCDAVLRSLPGERSASFGHGRASRPSPLSGVLLPTLLVARVELRGKSDPVEKSVPHLTRT